MFRRVLLAAAVLLLPILATSCVSTQVREQALTGQPPHERHATGPESQVADHP
jgi:hypothetical protein